MPRDARPAPPYHMKFLECARCSRYFGLENSAHHPITLPMFGHTMCKQCIIFIRDQTKCSQDQILFGTSTPIDQLPINYSLLTIRFGPSNVNI